MITIKEIARMLGVSPTTVSNVLNGRTEKMSEQTRIKIEEMLVQCHYVQESRKREGQEELKLVLAQFYFGGRERVFTDPFCAELFETMHRELAAKGRNLVCSTVETEEAFLRTLSGRNVEGGIVLGCEPSRCESLRRRALKPLVFIDSGEGNYDNIGLQDELGAWMMVSYLIRQGHERIAFFCDEETPKASNLERFHGYCRALADCGLGFNREDYYYLPADRNLREAIYRQFAREAGTKGYTAAFFVADFYANEAINGFFAAGLKVPEDLSAAGFDDNVYARLSRPMLTTVRQQPSEKGREAVRLLLKRIYGQEVLVRSMELPTELIVRDSVRNIRTARGDEKRPGGERSGIMRPE